MDSTQVILESLKWVFTFKDFVPAIAAFLGVLVGASVSIYVARLQFRAQVKAKHRLEWVSVLRETIAEYQTNAFLSTPNSRERASSLYNKIKLMLNPSDSQHAELLKVMQTMDNEQRRDGGMRVAEMVGCDHKVTDAARAILSEEIEKANRGK